MELRGFQKEGVDHLKLVRARLLGDEMGLGKTVEAIALDLEARKEVTEKATTAYKRLPPTLVIAPMTLLQDPWASHFADWEPNLKVCTIDRKNRTVFESAVEKATHDVYVVHWDVLRMLPQLEKRTWLHIIGDEIHRISNRDSQMTHALKKLHTVYKTGASGTPAQTRPQDLWSILNWLYPRTYTSYWRFFNHHCIYKVHNAGWMGCSAEGCVQSNGQPKVHKTTFKELVGVEDAEGLHEQMKPFYVRRLKEDVMKDLPPKTYSTIHVELDPRQRKAYNQMRDDMLAWVGQNADQPLAAPMAIAKLVRLQQLSASFASIETVMKGRRVTDPKEAAWRKIPLGSIVKEPKKIVRLIEPSCKIDAAMQIIEDNPGKPFVFFSISKQVMNLFSARLAKHKTPHGLLTGDTEQDERTKIVRDFQAGKIDYFLGTIQAGGVGITLTRADTCVFFDRDWSAGRNVQAEDRVHRIGQESAVQIIDIIGKDTVDMGKLQHFEQSWDWLKQILGDKRD